MLTQKKITKIVEAFSNLLPTLVLSALKTTTTPCIPFSLENLIICKVHNFVRVNLFMFKKSRQNISPSSDFQIFCLPAHPKPTSKHSILNVSVSTIPPQLLFGNLSISEEKSLFHRVFGRQKKRKKGYEKSMKG